MHSLLSALQSFQAHKESGLREWELVQLQVVLGVAWGAGAGLCGVLCLQRSRECAVSRQYLAQVMMMMIIMMIMMMCVTQASLVIAAVSILALNTVRNQDIINADTDLIKRKKSN